MGMEHAKDELNLYLLTQGEQKLNTYLQTIIQTCFNTYDWHFTDLVNTKVVKFLFYNTYIHVYVNILPDRKISKYSNMKHQ